MVSSQFRRILLMVSVPAILITAFVVYFLASEHVESTDNAYIHQHKVSLSTEVGGRIIEVAVRENQQVSAGDLLFRIDPKPYELAVAEAKASLAVAVARVEKLETDLSTSDVDINSAQEDIAYFAREHRRQVALLKTKVTSDAAVQAAEHSLSEARSKLATAQANAAKAKVSLSTGGHESGANPEIQEAQVRLQKAELDLSRTRIAAPVSGIITQSERLQKGQLMLQSLPAVTIIQSDHSWIEANFKETQLTHMRVGQPVSVSLDIHPDLAISGTVDSIGAGTGSEFSILPAQNANGNWVKVTQRIPVRIKLDQQPDRQLIAGLSAHVRVDTSK